MLGRPVRVCGEGGIEACLSKSAADIVFRSLAVRIRKDGLRIIHLDEPALEEEGRFVTAS